MPMGISLSGMRLSYLSAVRGQGGRRWQEPRGRVMAYCYHEGFLITALSVPRLHTCFTRRGQTCPFEVLRGQQPTPVCHSFVISPLLRELSPGRPFALHTTMRDSCSVGHGSSRVSGDIVYIQLSNDEVRWKRPSTSTFTDPV